ncbi:STAS domain-containing protein [Actinomadura rifamycini]|uniref:STAS domain-containing protein n=1 Tax=Actinomadura rifamycini TaxID=31962 RepID=UPI00047ADC50|nr:STAS domain-containing protein [Actinomadura rifamycini]
MRTPIHTAHAQHGVTIVMVGRVLDPGLCPACEETIKAVRAEINAAQHEAGHRTLVLDLSNMPEIRPEGAHLLCQARNRAEDQGTTVVLAGLRHRPMARLRLYGVARFFPHYDSVENAVATFTEDSSQEPA